MLPKYRKPTHPGEILWEDFLKPLGITQTQFAEYLGGSWTQPKLSAIIRGTRSITEEIALDLADALGTSPEFWIHLQANCDLWEAKQRHKSLKPLPIIKNRLIKARRLRKEKLLNNTSL